MLFSQTKEAISLSGDTIPWVNDTLSTENISFKMMLDSTIDTVVPVMSQIAENTHYAPWVLINIVLALVGVVVSSLAALYSYRTAANVKRVNKETQKYLFVSLIRHLYRNEICTLVIAAKMNSYVNQRPSEDHILKLKTLPEDIHLDVYNSHPEYYAKLHEIKILLRNYNTEIDVFQVHLLNPTISIKEKKDRLNTLLFKPFYLASEILEVINGINKDNSPEEILILVLSEHCNKISKGNSKQVENQEEDLKKREKILESFINSKALEDFIKVYQKTDINNIIELTFSDKNKFLISSFLDLSQNEKESVKKELEAIGGLRELIKHILVYDASIEYSKIKMIDSPNTNQHSID